MKVYCLLVLPIFLVSFSAKSQDYSDNIRLSKLDYMVTAYRTNCESTTGTNVEHKICLNREFQTVDSAMNTLFIQLLEMDKSIADSVRRELLEYQKVWVENRRFQSRYVSAGFGSHMFGISYLSTMVRLTALRIKELEYLINNS